MAKQRSRRQQAVMKRLDLAKETVAAAKRAYVRRTGMKGVQTRDPEALERVHFREVLDHAVEHFLDRLRRELRGIGLVRRENDHRPRPVSIATWNGPLEELRSSYDLSKIQIIRCLLEMLAASEG
jgi:hypothetical protein